MASLSISSQARSSVIFKLRIIRNLAIICVIGLSSGCGRSDETNTFLIADVCIDAKSNIQAVKNMISDVARTSDMNIYDRSDETFAEMNRIVARNPDLKVAPATLNMKIENRDNIGLVAGNLGLPRRQFGIGFFRMREDKSSKEFSTSTVKALEGRGWRVKVLPGNHTVVPDKGCA